MKKRINRPPASDTAPVNETVETAGTPLPELPGAAQPTGEEQTSNSLDGHKRSLPPVADLVRLLGAPAVLRALTAAGVSDKAFAGFRPLPKSLGMPLIRGRIQELLSQEGLTRELSKLWMGQTSPLRAALEQQPDAEELRRLSSRHGAGVVLWAIELHADAALKEFAQLARESNVLVEPEMESRPAVPAVNEAPPSSPPSPTAGADELSAARREIKRLQEAIRKLQQDLAAAGRQEGAHRAEMKAHHRNLDATGKETEEWKRRAESAEGDLRSLRRKVEKLQQSFDAEKLRADGAERKLRRSEKEAAAPPRPSFPRAVAPPPRPAAAPSLEAGILSAIVARLMEKRRYAAAADLARELGELKPGHREALNWLIAALSADGKREEAASFRYNEAVRLLQSGSRTEGIEQLCESIRLTEEQVGLRWRMDKLLEVVDPASRSEIESVARLHGDLKRTSAPAAKEFENLVRKQRRALWRRLPEVEREQLQAVSIPWPGADDDRLGVEALAQAITSGDAGLVENFLRWAARQTGETLLAAQQLIEATEQKLPGAARILTGPTRPVIVDGSNVCWEGASLGSKPTMENLAAVRQKLYEQGFFPVLILADAALPWQVEEPELLERWRRRDEIRLVEGRTDADETVVSEARRLNCPIVSNDRMRELDPSGRVPRITFSLGPRGVTLKGV